MDKVLIVGILQPMSFRRKMLVLFHTYVYVELGVVAMDVAVEVIVDIADAADSAARLHHRITLLRHQSESSLLKTY
jgi:hypothetical protein